MVKVGSTYRIKYGESVHPRIHDNKYIKVLVTYSNYDNSITYSKCIIQGTGEIVYIHNKDLIPKDISYIATDPKNAPETNNG